MSRSSPAAVLWARTNGCRLVGLGWERRAHVRLGQCGARHFDACFRARAYAEPHAARWRTRQRFVQPRPRGSRDSLQLCRCDRPWVCRPQSVNLAGSLSGDYSLRFGADASRAPKSIACEARSGRRYVDARRVLRRLPQKSLSTGPVPLLAPEGDEKHTDECGITRVSALAVIPETTQNMPLILTIRPAVSSPPETSEVGSLGGFPGSK